MSDLLPRWMGSKLARTGIEYLVIPIALLMMLYFWWSERDFSNEVVEQIKRDQSALLQTHGRLMEQKFEQSLDALASLAAIVADNRTNPEVMRSAMEATLRSTEYAFQVRILSFDGQELHRIDRAGGSVHWVPDSDLQDKSSRDYIIELQSTPLNGLYASAIDLNIEGGKVEVPYRPTVRFGVSLGDIFVMINFDMSKTVNDVGVFDTPDISTWLINQNGDWLIGPTKELEWGFALGQRHTIFDFYPRHADAIMSELTTAQELEEGSILLSYRFGGGLYSTGSAFRGEQNTLTILRHFSADYISERVGKDQTLRLAISITSTTLIAVLLFIAISAWRRANSIRTTLEMRSQEMSRLHGIANVLPQLTWTCNGAGQCEFISENWARYSGEDVTRLVGEGWFDIVHPEDEPELTAHWRECVRTGDDFAHRFRIRNSKGEYRMFDARAVALKDRDGRVVQWFGSNSDVQDAIDLAEQLRSERDRLFVDLKASEADKRLIYERLEMAASAARLGAWEIDDTTGAMIWDERVFDIFGRDPKLGPLSFDDMLQGVEPVHMNAFRDSYRGLIRNGVDMNIEYRFTRDDGERIWIHALGSRQRLDDGARERIVGCCLDITQLKRTEDDLRLARDDAESANRAKSFFLANMSHELRTPMNGIIGMLGLLRESTMSAEQRRYLEKAYDSTERLLAILNDVLDLARIEAGAISLELNPFPIERLISDSVEVFAVNAENKSIDLSVYVAPGMPISLVGDEFRLSQIVSNIVGNAIKFTPAGRRVSVEFRFNSIGGDRHELDISVKDNGIGIEMDKLDAIFDAFSQADESTTRRFGGTGLGLSICKRLSDAMGGRISVESETGIGSVFSVQIPIALSDNPTAFKDLRLDARRLHVVSPDQTLQVMVRTHVSKWGMEVESFDNLIDYAASDALESLRSEDSILLFDAVHADKKRHPNALEDFWRTLDDDVDIKNLIVYSPARLSARERMGLASRSACVISIPLTPSRLYNALLTIFEGTNISDTNLTSQPATQDLLAGLKVLAVDDLPLNNEVVAGLLSRHGVEVECVGSGMQAIEAIQQTPYDVVLMDVHMDTMSGLEATARIRQLDIKQPLIFGLSASVMASDQRAGLEAGMNEYLMKPFRLDELLEVLKRHYDVDESASGVAPDSQSTVKTEAPDRSDNPYPEFIDIGDLRARLQDEELVHRSLEMFAQTYAKEASVLRDTLAGQDAELAFIQVHRLVGAARSIGDPSLAEMAGELEQKIRDAGVDKNDVAIVDVLLSHVRQLQQSISDEGQGTPSRSRMSDQAFKSAFEELHRCFSASQFVSAEALDDVVEELIFRGFDHDARALREAALVFDFETAEAVMNEIQKRI